MFQKTIAIFPTLSVDSPLARMVLRAALIAAITLLTPTLILAEPAGPQVSLELAVDPRLPPLTQHEWAKALASVGIENLRIRMANPSDAPKIEEIPTGAAPTYRVLGVINNTNQLVLPDAQFSIRQASQVKSWLEDLARLGPPQARPKQVAFGLDQVQFQLVRQDLARSVDVSTKGQPRSQLVAELGRSLSHPLTVDPDAQKRIGGELWEEELKGMAVGTALAYILRYDGLGLLPEALPQGIRYRIVVAGPKRAVWPVGWPPEESEVKSVPKLLEMINVNIQNVPLTDVLASLKDRLDLLALFDHAALARFGIEPAKTAINIPQTRTSYSQIMRRSLFQARLKGEIRCDDAGKPFLWITTLRPVNEG